MSKKSPLHLPLESAIDRRVARTRTALYDAIVTLVRRKDYDAITVEDILAEADVGRSTFYAHFAGKDDLLSRSLERLRAVLLEAGSASPSGQQDLELDFSRALFEHISEYRDIHFALSGTRGGEIVDAAIGGVLERILRDTLPAKGAADAPPRELTIRYIVSTFMTVMTWWLDRNPQVTPENADKLFRQLAFTGLPGGGSRIYESRADGGLESRHAGGAAKPRASSSAGR